MVGRTMRDWGGRVDRGSVDRNEDALVTSAPSLDG